MAEQNVNVTIRARDLTAQAFASVNAALKQLEDEASGAAQKTKDLGNAGSSAWDSFKGFLGANLAMNALSGAFRFAKESIFGMNDTLETSTLQFETLMGSTSKAQAHIKDLFEIAKNTPFETQPIIDASKQLQVAGGEALNTKANIIMLGDAAAATGAPIDELGRWTGRLYAMLQAGKPFGEAAMRLQELAVLSPQARAEMEKLQASGASAEQIFRVFQDTMGKYTGAMAKQAKTWTGLFSTFMDSAKMAVAEGFKPIFETAKKALSQINDVLGSEAFTTGIKNVSTTIAQGFTVAFAVISKVKGPLVAVGSAVLEVVGYVKRFDEAVIRAAAPEIFKNLGRVFGEVKEAVATVTGLVSQGLSYAFRTAKEALSVPVYESAVSILKGLSAAFAAVWDVTKLVVGVFWDLAKPLLAPAWDAALSIFGGLSKALGVIFDVLGLVSKAVSYAITQWDLKSKALKTLQVLLTPITLGLRAVVATAGWLGDKIGWVADKIRELLKLAGLLEDDLPQVGGSASSARDALFNFGDRGIGPAADAAGLLNGTLGELAGEGLPSVITATKDAKDGAESLAKGLLKSNEQIEKFLSYIPNLKKVGGMLTQELKGAGSEGKQFDFLKWAIPDVKQIGGMFMGLMPAVKGNLDNAWNDIRFSLKEHLGAGFMEALHGFPDLLMRAFTGGGGMVGAMKAVGSNLGSILGEGLFTKLGDKMTGLLGKLGPKIGGAIFDMMPGIGGMIGSLVGPLLGKAWDGIKSLFGPGKEWGDVKSARAEFEQSFGGVEGMVAAVGKAYADLGKNGAAAESAIKRLWEAKDLKSYEAAVTSIKNTIAEAAKVSAETQAKIEADAKANAANLEAQLKPLRDQMEALTKEYESLSKSVASEAPEEVMGVIEANQRARMAEIEEERKALAKQMDAVNEAANASIQEQAQDTRSAIEQIFKEPFKARLEWDYEPPTGGFTGGRITGYASGSLITREQIARVGEGGEPELIGPVSFMTKALAGAISALGGNPGGGGEARITVQPRIFLNGRQIAEAMAPELPAVLKRYGIA